MFGNYVWLTGMLIQN